MSQLTTVIARIFSAKEIKPSVRVVRSYPLFGARQLVLHAPDSSQGNLHYLRLSAKDTVRFFIDEVDGKFAVFTGAQAEPLAIFDSREKAKDLVAKIALALAPKWKKRLFIVSAGATLIMVLSGPGSVTGPAALNAPGARSSMVAPRTVFPAAPGGTQGYQAPAATQLVGPGAASGPVTGAITGSAGADAAGSVVPAVPAAAASAARPPTDVADPFGLVIPKH